MKKIAFMFPGQGSQAIGMLSKIAAAYPLIEETFAEASTTLGYDLWKLIEEGPSSELNKTSKTQPAILVSSVALYRLWCLQYSDKIPDLMSGHSLGEYSALVCAGVMTFTDAVYLVELRGKLMQNAVPEGIGAMAAIVGLNPQNVIEACSGASSDNIVVSLVNFNTPDQVVISGHKEAVKQACKTCKKYGARRALMLPISVPSHCSLMKPASSKLALALAGVKLKEPTIPVINNVDANCYKNPDAIRDALVRQLYSPVKWTHIVEYIFTQGVEYFYEMGPGKVLTGLTKRIINAFTTSSCKKQVVALSALDQMMEEKEDHES